MSTTSARINPPTQVRHVRNALWKEFRGLIDLSNVESSRADEVERQFLSRSLAALAVRRLTGCSSQQAADSVIDGRNDQGIDAIAFADGKPSVFLIQAKWSDRGNASIDTAAALKMIDGFRQIDDHQFERFNNRFQAMAEKLRAVMMEPHLQVTLVQAVMGDGTLSPEVVAIFDAAQHEFNGNGQYLNARVIGGADLLQQVRDDFSETPISLQALMMEWITRNLPVEAYQGSVPADQISAWLAEFGDRLFEKNVRKSLGLTMVNQQMVETLITEPETFWYRNNGITVLCSEIETRWPTGRRQNAAVELHLGNASVVNGAQTVTAIHEAYLKDPKAVATAEVSVRVMKVPADEASFANIVTHSTNTQNHMEPRDFIALDEVQMAIREDFKLTLDKLYVFKRGDLEPAPDEGCSVVTAAIALACAHRNPEFVFRAKRDRNLLWEDDKGGAYPSLFGNQPSAGLIWNSVQLFRAVDVEVRRLIKKLEGRAVAVLERGDLLLTHLVFQVVDSDGLKEADGSWEIPGDVPDLVERAARWLVHEVDRLYGSGSYVSSIFAGHERFTALAKSVRSQLHSDQEAPDFGGTYLPAPRPVRVRARNAVNVLIDAGRIESGASLIYRPATEREHDALGKWLDGDDRRQRATWVQDRRKPLLWAVDGQRYSLSGLVMHMWQQAGWDDAPVAVQGPKCWSLGSEGTLVQLADELRRSEGTE